MEGIKSIHFPFYLIGKQLFFFLGQKSPHPGVISFHRGVGDAVNELFSAKIKAHVVEGDGKPFYDCLSKGSYHRGEFLVVASKQKGLIGRISCKKFIPSISSQGNLYITFGETA